MKTIKKCLIISYLLPFIGMGILYFLTPSVISKETGILLFRLWIAVLAGVVYLPLMVFFLARVIMVKRWKRFYTEKILLPGNAPLFYVPAVKSENARKPAVVICPGGSYHHLGMTNEGFCSARWFSALGIEAFVLRYRTAFYDHHYPDQINDISSAIKYIRDNAEKYGVDASKVGAIGYSAGGHLVASSAENTDKSLRPDFVMPIYPVVTLQDDIGHKWSRKSLFPKNVTQEQKDLCSLEMHVPEDMCPAFLLACEDDPIVIYENSVRFDKAMTDKNIPHVFVSYTEGGHGFGMKNGWFMKKYHWNDEKLLPWLKSIGIAQ